MVTCRLPARFPQSANNLLGHQWGSVRAVSAMMSASGLSRHACSGATTWSGTEPLRSARARLKVFTPCQSGSRTTRGLLGIAGVDRIVARLSSSVNAPSMMLIHFRTPGVPPPVRDLEVDVQNVQSRRQFDMWRSPHARSVCLI